MINRNDALLVVRQCEILSLSRSSVCYRRQPVSPEDLAPMRRIDELHLELPFAGARMLHDLLRLEGFRVGRRQRIARLIYRKPSTSSATPGTSGVSLPAAGTTHHTTQPNPV